MFNLRNKNNSKEIDSSKDNAKEDSKEAKNSTIGMKIVSNEAHYFYPFVINPLAYKEYEELGVTDGYTEDDYAKFKEAALVSATSFSTNSKIGCENEFALFVETKEDLYLPNLAEFIIFDKGEDKNTIEINCDDLLNSLQDKIYNIEVYFNPYTTNIRTEIKRVKEKNIFTKKDIVREA